MSRKDLLIAPLGEAALILIAALAGWLTRQPVIFASLGPTAYELIETPHRRSARPYCIFVGHLMGILAGLLALFLTGAWNVPAVSAGGVPLLRVWAAVLASAVTVFVTLLFRASQPAATSTTLLVALGMMQTPRDLAVILGSVTLMIAVGEPLRHLRMKSQQGRSEKPSTDAVEENPQP